MFSPKRLLAIGVFLSVASLLAVGAYRILAAPSIDELKRQGQVIIEALDAYKAEHGVDPDSLESASIAPNCTWYGGWQYDVTKDGSECGLTIGKYSDDLFVLWWSSTDRKWWTDT
jgi:type II secretory pathway pseudopilin PulG